MSTRVRIENLAPPDGRALVLQVGDLLKWREIHVAPGQSVDVEVHRLQTVLVQERKP